MGKDPARRSRNRRNLKRKGRRDVARPFPGPPPAPTLGGSEVGEGVAANCLEALRERFEVLFQRHGLIVVRVLRSENQSHCLVGGLCAQFIDRLALGFEFREVAAFEFRPIGRGRAQTTSAGPCWARFPSAPDQSLPRLWQHRAARGDPPARDTRLQPWLFRRLA